MDADTTMDSMPLLELFKHLRGAGLPLGVDEYQALLCALQGGFGLPDRAALARLCKTLWVKSAEDERLFDDQFKLVLARVPASEASPSLAAASKISAPASPSSATEPKRTSIPAPAPSSETPSPSAIPSEALLHLEDEVQVAKAVLQAVSGDDDSSYSYLMQTDEYFPITRRQMKQSWRYLRRPAREGPPVELDIESTAREIGRQGRLLQPVMVPRRTNRTQLLLLIDHGGSMVPFHSLSRRLAETALRGGRLDSAGIYYFHNCPTEYLYRDSADQESELLQDIFAGLHVERTGALIFSDAGAARGGLDAERAELTEEFLKQLKQGVRYMTWLNPMPRSRWAGTTASRIMRSIPMFDLSRRGLDDAISVLRGRPLPYTSAEAIA